MRFLSDLVNCHVIAAPSMVAMFENFISVTQEEDVPQVVRIDTFLSNGYLLNSMKETEFILSTSSVFAALLSMLQSLTVFKNPIETAQKSCTL